MNDEKENKARALGSGSLSSQRQLACGPPAICTGGLQRWAMNGMARNGKNGKKKVWAR